MSKTELIESFTKSLKNEKIAKTDSFYKSFGAFSEEKSAEEIIVDIKANRSFRNSEISL